MKIIFVTYSNTKIEKRMENKLTTERLLIESDLRDNH